ncbi:MAG: hypothetical protein KKH95_13175 [Gammaproteobacteria bacterium]|nr:hypothetical protein [Gammaproteobacteria bacterium]
MSLVDAMLMIQDIVGNVAGVRSAPEYIPEKPGPGIFAVTLLSTGVFKQEPVQVLCGLHNFQLYVICPRMELPKTLKAILPLGELVAAELENNETLRGFCSTFGEIPYTFEYNINLGTPAEPLWYAGWIFTISGIKVEDSEILT